MDNHKNNFNFLRLSGALLVIFSHSFDITGKEDIEPVKNLLRGQTAASGIGLTIFFFISGYFITKSAYVTKNALQFIQKRFFRIYPALLLTVLLTVFVIGPIFTRFTLSQYFTTTDTWKYLYTATGIRIRHVLPGVFTEQSFFINGVNASLWTISLEIMLYISIIFFYILHISKRGMALIAGSVIIICTVLTSANIITDFFYIKYINLSGIFFLGSFFYSSSLNKKQELLLLLLTITIYILLLSFEMNAGFLFFLIIGIVTYFLGNSNTLKIYLNNDISYGTYLFAFPIQQAIFRMTNFNTSIILLLIFSLSIIIPAAFLSWLFIEKPCILMNKKRFS